MRDDELTALRKQAYEERRTLSAQAETILAEALKKIEQNSSESGH